MKKVILLLALAVGFASCEGDQGPPGLDGFDGEDAPIPQSFEVELDFAAPNFSNRIEYPNDIFTAQDDMVLIYLLIEEAPADDGGFVDVWGLLPYTVYSEVGEFQYNNDFTAGDATIFIEGPESTNREELSDEALINQVFRIVILPIDFIGNNPNLDITDYQSVINLAGLNPDDIIEIQK